MVLGGRGVGLAMVLLAACRRSHVPDQDFVEAGPSLAWTPAETAPGSPRPGMAWIPAGVLRAGSESDDVPRVADAEMPGVDVSMAGFYMDVLPWPNEPGAIPTTNVTRAEAKRLCDEKGKRLCSEMEWERACKGPDNLRFEYGPIYDSRVCGTGVSAEMASQRPSGQRPTCRSTLGIRDMHGGPAEWTDSRWGRGVPQDLGVVRGGSDGSGELSTRCAFARPLAPMDRSAFVGFRCCAGPRNEAEVELEVKKGIPFERTANPGRTAPALATLDGVACGSPASPSPCSFARAWTWRPVVNVELSLTGGCVGRDPSARCAVSVWRTVGERIKTLAEVDTGRQIPEVVLVEGPDHRLRIRGADTHQFFFREMSFSHGRVDTRTVH